MPELSSERALELLPGAGGRVGVRGGVGVSKMFTFHVKVFTAVLRVLEAVVTLHVNGTKVLFTE